MSAGARWLSIIGIGEDGWDSLTAPAKDALRSAELVFGGERHLALVPGGELSGQAVAWPSPMGPVVREILEQHRAQRNVAVLASGDPMLHGIGATLTRSLPRYEFTVFPQPSSFSLACARLGWPMAETTLVSLVNRPVDHLARFLHPGERLLVLSENGSTPVKIAEVLCRTGYGPSLVDVLERLGGPAERIVSATASNWPDTDSAALNVVAIECIPEAGLKPLSLTPGLPDEAFVSDGQMTRREVRAITLAHLAPLPGQRLWDVGAGTGTIAIEWMRAHPSCSAVAFEERLDRAARIRENARNFGLPALAVCEGRAPETFAGVPAPDALFLGGGLTEEGLFESCWNALRPGGRFVANAVTIPSEALLTRWHTLYGGDLLRIQISRADNSRGPAFWRPAMPITQWTVTKA